VSDRARIGEADCGVALREGERGRLGDEEGPVPATAGRRFAPSEGSLPGKAGAGRVRILRRMLDCEVRDIVEILFAVTYWRNF
jgi:hypothetical protein